MLIFGVPAKVVKVGEKFVIFHLNYSFSNIVVSNVSHNIL